MRTIRFPGPSPLESEGGAWAFLDWLREQPRDAVLENGTLSAPTWTAFALHYEGAQYDATLTTPMMEALLVLQSGIHRSYALTKYGDEKASRLTEADKSNTSIIVAVRSGTSGLDIDATAIANHFIDVAGSRMNAIEVVAVAVTAIVLFFGTSAFKVLMSQRAKIQLARIEAEENVSKRASRAEERAENVRQTIALSQEETKRLDTLNGIIKHFPATGVVQNEATRVVDATLKSIARDEDLKVQGISISGPVAADIIATPRSSADEITIKSIFQIMSVDGTTQYGFRARLRNVQNGELFNATLKDTFLSEKEGETVQTAFWQKKLVYLELDARLLRGQVKDAEILKAKITDQTASERSL